MEQPQSTTLRSIALVTLAMCLLSACAVSLTYNRLDWLIPWYLDGYVDLTKTQRQALQAQLEPWLAWHREEELARYIEILDRVEADLDSPVEPNQVRSWAEELLAAAQRVERSMLEVALVFGDDVRDEQTHEFMDSLWKQQREYEEEFLTRSNAEYALDDFDNLSDFLKRFLGRLSAEQKIALREAAEGLQRFDRAWLEERSAWLNTLEPLLLARAPGWQEAVMAAYETHVRERTPAYHATLNHNLELISQAYARVLTDMSEKQRNRARGEIEDLRRTLRKLMVQPAGTRRAVASMIDEERLAETELEAVIAGQGPLIVQQALKAGGRNNFAAVFESAHALENGSALLLVADQPVLELRQAAHGIQQKAVLRHQSLGVQAKYAVASVCQ
jgi:hypothetical protein